jgi:hypothetical protein
MEVPFDIDNYHRIFKDYPKCLMESAGRVYGQYFIGNYYKRKNGYYGEYPPGYLKRIRALFPNRKPALHLFGGTVEPEEDEFTVDINPERNPSVCCEATEIHKYFDKDTFEIIYADPPYSKVDAEKYGYAYPNKKMVLRACRKIAKQGSVLVWLDTSVPIFRKGEWNLLGMIGVFTGTNRVLRSATLFEASKDKTYQEFLEAEDQKSKLKK